jgi:hypothetical protein
LKDLREGAGDQRLLEKIARMIPGYGDYKDKELRREADKRARMYLARRLGEEKSRLQAVSAKVSDKMFLDALGPADRTGRRLEKLIDRIRFASYGYAGFFDIVKVREDLLDKVYEFDASLLEDLERIREKMGELEGSLETQAAVTAKVEELDTLIGEIDNKLNQREDFLKGVK